jgi:peptidoglycan-N-acetylglucosamine deacetylase
MEMGRLICFVSWLFILFCCACAFGQNREVVVTFDDLPTTYDYTLQAKQELTKKLLASIKSNKIPAIGFVNEAKLYVPGEIDERTELLRMWLDAGLELGNHTFSHINLEKAPIEAYEEDVIRGETITRMLMTQKNMKLRYFRHPQLFTGMTVEYKNALDTLLKNRGYTIAPVTIDNNDYIFAYIYYKAKQKGDSKTMAEVGAAYVPYMEKMFEFFEQLSKDSFGYEIKQVLLLHANELNADYFDKLAAMMKRRGYSFITLEEALKDKTYTLPDAQMNRGVSWIHRWRMAKHLPMVVEPSEPEFITKMFKDAQQQSLSR